MKLTYWCMLFVLACGCYACAGSKGIIKLYAYQRSAAPGTVPTVIAEDGTVKERAAKRNLYRYIYIEHKHSAKGLVPLQLWINQQPYAVEYQEMKSTPVVADRGSDPQKDTLVPATTNAIMQVMPRKALNDSVPPSLKESIEQNEVVILYNYGNKTYHAAVRRLKNLSSFILQ